MTKQQILDCYFEDQMMMVNIHKQLQTMALLPGLKLYLAAFRIFSNDYINDYKEENYFFEERETFRSWMMDELVSILISSGNNVLKTEVSVVFKEHLRVHKNKTDLIIKGKKNG